MIVAEQMQQPMREQEIHLVVQAMPMLLSLRLRARDRDHDVTEPPTRDFRGTGQGTDRVRGQLGEREHVGGFVLTPPVTVQRLDLRVVSEENRKLSLF